MSGVSGPTAGVSGCYTPLYWRFFTFPVVLYCARVVRFQCSLRPQRFLICFSVLCL